MLYLGHAMQQRVKLSNKPTNTLKKSLCHLKDKRVPQEKTNVGSILN